MDMSIQLSDLKMGTPGITPVEGANLYENCVVQLHQCGHPEKVMLEVKGMRTGEVALVWEDVYTDWMKRTYADEQSVTERAAVGISVLLAMRITDFTVIERSRKGTGFDYLLGEKHGDFYDPKARMEVSGISKETSTNTVLARYQAKVKQTDKSDDTMFPAYISIVEFSTPKALFGLKDKL